jgi:hypothetical protein
LTLIIRWNKVGCFGQLFFQVIDVLHNGTKICWQLDFRFGRSVFQQRLNLFFYILVVSIFVARFLLYITLPVFSALKANQKSLDASVAVFSVIFKM